MWSSRTCVSTRNRIGSPAAGTRPSVRAEAKTRYPTPFTSSTTPSARRWSTTPESEAIMAPPQMRIRPAPLRPSGGRGRGPRRRRGKVRWVDASQNDPRLRICSDRPLALPRFARAPPSPTRGEGLWRTLPYLVCGGVVGVADGDGKRVGGIGARQQCRRQEALHHHLHLRLFRVADAHHRLLDEVGGVFEDGDAARRRREQHHAAGDAELQGGGWVLVDEGLLDSGRIGPKFVEHAVELAEELDQALGERHAGGRVDDTVGDVDETIAMRLDHAPTGVAQARIESDKAHDAGPALWRRRDQALTRAMTSSDASKLA